MFAFMEFLTLLVITAAGGVFWSLLGYIKNSRTAGDTLDFSKIGKNAFIGVLVGIIAGVYALSTGQAADFNSMQSISVWFFVGFSGSVIVDKLFSSVPPSTTTSTTTTTTTSSPVTPSA